jgi:hypothetical protein
LRFGFGEDEGFVGAEGRKQRRPPPGFRPQSLTGGAFHPDDAKIASFESGECGGDVSSCLIEAGEIDDQRSVGEDERRPRPFAVEGREPGLGRCLGSEHQGHEGAPPQTNRRQNLGHALSVNRR